MDTRISEIADGIYRISTFVPRRRPDRVHLQPVPRRRRRAAAVPHRPRAMFPLGVRGDRDGHPGRALRWITFGHVESDECGAMNQWLAAAPQARSRTARSAAWCRSTTCATARRDRSPTARCIDIGGKRLRHLDTPHVPHGWEAQVLFEETTGTLLCGDLFTQLGDPAAADHATTSSSRRWPAEDVFRATCLAPEHRPDDAALADLEPTTLALMHGPSYTGRRPPGAARPRRRLRRPARRGLTAGARRPLVDQGVGARSVAGSALGSGTYSLINEVVGPAAGPSACHGVDGVDLVQGLVRRGSRAPGRTAARPRRGSGWRPAPRRRRSPPPAAGRRTRCVLVRRTSRARNCSVCQVSTASVRPLKVLPSITSSPVRGSRAARCRFDSHPSRRP